MANEDAPTQYRLKFFAALETNVLSVSSADMVLLSLTRRKTAANYNVLQMSNVRLVEYTNRIVLM